MPELAICHCYTPSHFLSPPTLGAEKNTASLCVSSTNASAVLQQRFNVENLNPPPENQELGFRAGMPVPVATASLMHSALTNSVSCVAYCDCSPPSCKSGKLDNNNYTYIGNAFVLPAERKKKRKKRVQQQSTQVHARASEYLLWWMLTFLYLLSSGCS